VSRGRILIIEADEWVTTLVSRFLVGAGYEVDVAASARGGFDRAVASAPDLVLVDVALPDIDGFWVIKRIRSENTRLATTPVLLISQREDHLARLEGLALGSDVFLAAPFRHDEVIAQVEALMGMAQRLRAKRETEQSDGPSTLGRSAIRGDIGQISIATVLTMLEMERRTGRVQVHSRGKQSVTLEVVEGSIVGALRGRAPRPAITLLREIVGWNQGTYAFEPMTIQLDAPRHPIGMLLLEAMRLNDEQNH